MAVEPDTTVEDAAAEARKYSHEAGQLFLAGDRTGSKQLYCKSGDIYNLLAGQAPKPMQRDIVRLLATTEYYKAGRWDLANTTFKRIKVTRLIHLELKQLHASFKFALSYRSSPDYKQKFLKDLNILTRRREYDAALKLLSEHPWVLQKNEEEKATFDLMVLAGHIDLDAVENRIELAT